MPVSNVRRVAMLLTGLALAVVALGARCIENTSIYVDGAGYTHIVGNMTNETDISASTVTLRGQLFDGDGNVIAETTGILCPMTVQPHSQNAFDLRFDQQGLPAAASFDVRPIAGTTLDHPLTDPHLALADFRAFRVNGTLQALGFVHNNGSQRYPEARYCSAAYDASGVVVNVQASPVDGGALGPGQVLKVPIVWSVLPASATQLVVWISVGPGTQWVVSDRLPIQNAPPH